MAVYLYRGLRLSSFYQHVGFFEEDYCPWKRGFDEYLGYLTGSEDYNSKYSGKGIDFRNGSEPCNSTESKRYSTELYSDVAEGIIRRHNAETPLFLYLALQAVHEPMEAPDYYTEPYNETIPDPSRLAMAGEIILVNTIEICKRCSEGSEIGGSLSRWDLFFS